MTNTLITGGSGFLGRGIMSVRGDDECVVYSRDEYKQDKCRARYPDAKYVLGDITDFYGLCRIIRAYSVDTIIHTAAIKYIPEAEQNVLETLRINLDGSRTVFDAAVACGVNRVVAISTDKATSPLNVYGASKLLMERMVCEYARLTNVNFTCTRYGNVVGSTGSVVPKFKQQLIRDGYVSITDPEMTRYWLSIKEAVQLVDIALKASTGAIIIPNPGAMKLSDLALAITGSQDRVRITGVRPGEKTHESLLNEYEAIRSRRVDDHIELLPYPQGDGVEPLVSSNPAYWISPESFLDMIEESEYV